MESSGSRPRYCEAAVRQASGRRLRCGGSWLPENRWGGNPCGDFRPTLFSGLGALPYLVEGALEDLVRLGAEQEQPAVEDEGGDGVDSRLLRLGRRGVDATGVEPPGERGGGFLAVEAGFGHEVEQRLRVADVPRFRPV